MMEPLTMDKRGFTEARLYKHLVASTYVHKYVLLRHLKSNDRHPRI